MKIASVTIDLDGTLADTVADLAHACQAMLADLGQPTRSEEEIRSFVGKGMLNLVTRCLTRTWVPDEAAVGVAVARFRFHYAACNGQGSVLYPGVLEGLECWRQTGLALACVTNKPAAFTVPLLRHLGVAHYFSAVVSGDTLEQRKPSPEPLLYACSQLAVPIEHNIHIGDSDTDVQAARAAGCAAWGVPYGYNEGGGLRAEDCDRLIPDLATAASLTLAD
jgi:phosphoglycolate phosphatase